MDRWVGRVAIVTGASSGIGEAIAKILAKNGMKVVGVARRQERMQELVNQLGKVKGEMHAVHGDVTKEEDVARVVKWTRDHLGGTDVLVNCAGIGSFIPLPNADTAKMRSIYDTNVLGLNMFTRDVIKDMRERGVNDGHIFHMGSFVGQQIINFPGAYVYSSSKHAVRVLTEGLRRELRDLGTNIRVTGISPGLVRSQFMANGGASEQMVNKMMSENKFLEPCDVAEALLYALATPPHVQVHDITLLPLGQKH